MLRRFLKSTSPTSGSLNCENSSLRRQSTTDRRAGESECGWEINGKKLVETDESAMCMEIRSQWPKPTRLCSCAARPLNAAAQVSTMDSSPVDHLRSGLFSNLPSLHYLFHGSSEYSHSILPHFYLFLREI